MTDNRAERGQQEVLKFSMQQARRDSSNLFKNKDKIGIRERIDLEDRAEDTFHRAADMIRDGISTGVDMQDYLFMRLGAIDLGDKQAEADLTGKMDQINNTLKGKRGEPVLVIDKYINSDTNRGNIWFARYRGGILTDDRLQFEPRRIICTIPAENCLSVAGVYPQDIDRTDLPINPTLFTNPEKYTHGENMLVFVGFKDMLSWAKTYNKETARYVNEQIARVLPRGAVHES